MAKVEIKGKYLFESITVKTTEKRLDGFFKRTDGKGPIFFLEVQGYDDPVIFWRLFREICTWYEQSGSVNHTSQLCFLSIRNSNLKSTL